tara:strand:+ start:1205 stop:2434 length:1230 start_codon:yes stop_codon:yes gene_type:complete
MSLKNKKILLIVGGGIAAYKTLDIIRFLKKKNAYVKTILTKSGKEFVTPLSLASLTKNKVYEEIFDAENESEIDHISLSRWADIILVVPTTANLMSKLSVGRAEDLATTVILASDKDIILVPAMNVRMWLHKATQNNLETLMSFGYKFIGPIKGEMACGEYGEGRMSSPRQIFSFLKNYFDKRNFLKEKKLKALVTTGPTREYLDPIRFISNESSGKQGYEIALALAKYGIKTTLVAGPSNINPSSDLKIKNVKTSNQMLTEVKKLLPVDIAVCAAAVSDFKPKKTSKNKIKKKENNFNNIELEKNQDILDFLGKSNRLRPKIVVGFSAETENLIKNSFEKLKEKYCDLIIANDVSRKNTGINSDYNEVIIINKKGETQFIKKNKKNFIASVIAKKIIDKFLINKKNIN